MSDAKTYNLGSIDKWIAADKRNRLSYVKVIDDPMNPLLFHLVEVLYYEDVGDSRRQQVINTTEIYFEYGGQAYAALLSFNTNDPASATISKRAV